MLTKRKSPPFPSGKGGGGLGSVSIKSPTTEKGDLIKADADTPGAFRETIGVETVFPHQIQRIAKNEHVRMRLLKIMDDLSEHHLEEIIDFAEFLYHKQHQDADTAYPPIHE